MAKFSLGRLSSVPASERPELLADPTREALVALGLLDDLGVVEIDPALSDTASTQQHYGLEPDPLANCVVVGRKARRYRAPGSLCRARRPFRADVNGFVKRFLDVRKARSCRWSVRSN